MNSNTLWSYSDVYEDNWNNNITDDNWDKSKLSEIPQTSEISLYLRYINNFDNLYDYSAFSMKIGYKSGLLLYINGNEIYRDNLPKNGIIEPDTEATNCYDEIKEYTLILPLNLIEKEKTIFSIELHRNDSEELFPQITFELLYIIGEGDDECLPINILADPVIEYSSYIQESKTNDVYSAFDREFDTFWIQPYKGNDRSWALLSFDNKYVSFNQLSLLLYFYNSAPNIINLNITTFNDTIVKSLTNLPYSNFRQTYVLFSPLYSLLSGVNLSFPEIIGSSNQFGIQDIGLHLCYFHYCPAFDTAPESLTGTSVEINCRDSEGTKVLTCPKGRNPHWIEQSNSCKDNPKLIYKYDNYKFKAGNNYTSIELFRVSGNKLSYYMWNSIFYFI